MLKTIAAALTGAALFAASALAAEKCTASADSAWDSAGKGVTIEAFASGSKCETAMAALVIRDETGTAAFYEVYPAEFVMVLAGMATAKDLEAALKSWIDTSQPQFASTADLPAWAEGAEYPVLGDFAFYPEEGIDRATYTKVRDSKAPIFCYVQGMESMACVVKDAENGGFFKLGVQTFPG